MQRMHTQQEGQFGFIQNGRSVGHIGHKSHGVAAPRSVHHKEQHRRIRRRQRFADNLSRSGPRKHLDLTGSVHEDVFQFVLPALDQRDDAVKFGRKQIERR